MSAYIIKFSINSWAFCLLIFSAGASSGGGSSACGCSAGGCSAGGCSSSSDRISELGE